MRLFLAMALVVVAAALWWQFSTPYPVFGAGFESPTRAQLRVEVVLAMATVGLLGAQLGGRMVWLAAAIFILAAIGAVFLASNSIVTLGYTDRAAAIALLVMGFLVALGGSPVAWIAMIGAVFGGLISGYLVGRTSGSFGDAWLFYAGFALSAAALAAIGLLVGEAAGKVLKGGDVRARVGAAVAGVGLLLTLARFNIVSFQA